VRKMSIGENYVGKLTPMRSNISRFSRGTVSNDWFEFWKTVRPQIADPARSIPVRLPTAGKEKLSKKRQMPK